MTTAEQPAAQPAPALEEQLLQLELRVARRADELSRGIDFTRARDLLIWFQAERDVLGHNHSERPMSVMQAAVA